MRMIDIPPVWLALFAFFAWILRAGPSSALMGGLGWALILLGAGLMVWALVTMMAARTTPVPHQMPSALVTTGPFRFSRNPIYLGDALVLTGLCLIWNVAWGFVLVPLFIGLIRWRFVAPEEDRLKTVFGATYEDWANRTRPWL